MPTRTALTLSVVTLIFAFAAPAQDVLAQGSGIVGGTVGAAGAVVGGVGRAAGAVAAGTISAATAVTLGTKLEPRAGGHYWYDGHCYRKNKDGSYRSVSTRSCG